MGVNLLPPSTLRVGEDFRKIALLAILRTNTEPKAKNAKLNTVTITFTNATSYISIFTALNSL